MRIVYNSDMEIANLAPPQPHIRPATKQDASAVMRLLQGPAYQHLHVDWFLPGDWLDTPGFVLYEQNGIQGCLAVAAEPPPAAWVRVAAVAIRHQAQQILEPLFGAITPHLHQQHVTQLGWMSSHRWADRWLPHLGFQIGNWIESYMKEDMVIPPHAEAAVEIRPVQAADFAALADLEAAAFSPLWRHSLRGLRLAQQQAISFDVALQAGQIVGFQHSVATQNNCAHLARMTIHPRFQGHGVGSTLMAHTLRGYAQLGFTYASLNTQTDNIASQKLYGKFGFRPIDYRLPVWVRELAG